MGSGLDGGSTGTEWDDPPKIKNYGKFDVVAYNLLYHGKVLPEPERICPGDSWDAETLAPWLEEIKD